MDLETRIHNRTARICVLGLGYVGLPLATEFAEAGYSVVGVDLDPSKVGKLRDGQSYIPDIATSRIAPLVNSGSLTATTDYTLIDPAPDAVFICVPTPYTSLKVPDVSYISKAAETIAAGLCAGQLIVLESTTYPGTTEELVLPILEAAGDLRHERDFFLAFSPERIDPGHAHYDIGTVPKVVGGAGPNGLRLAALLFESIAPGKVHAVSSARTAEMAKLLENTFRSVNIALVNELALLAERMGIDIWEVIDAASTKPFGFMPFYPGPGVGGHCIPVDPFYLSWKAREFDFYTRFVELAAEINDNMPFHTAELVTRALNSYEIPTKNARVLVLGVAFKRDVDDARNSPARRVVELLLARGAKVTYHDPHVTSFKVASTVFSREPETELRSVPLTAKVVRDAHAVVVVTPHRTIDFDMVAREAAILVDATGATRDAGRSDIWRLGAPLPPQRT
ncbi:MAG: nucleotide sugar dehydrogenase [Chloroflexi bacterium]|nr:nucleotide sugar dehydrogenase [Chloroflexota bacterium]MDB5075279.1 nucleotide sugar dehydrogenase [Chloroflexota bacterium]